jgi:lipid A disaccharide synthetase
VRLARKEQPDLRALLSIPKGSLGVHIPTAQGYFDGREIIPRFTKRTEHANVLVSTQTSAHEIVALENVSHSAALPAVADFSIVKSGTSTLEAGLAGNPLCVIYRGSPISYSIAHLLVNIPVFSLINIVLGRYVVPELLQSDVNPARLAHEIRSGLSDSHYRDQQRAALAVLPKKLGGPGASDRTAQGIFDFLHGKS